MALQDNTEDFRSEMRAYKSAYEQRFDERNRLERINQRLWYAVALLASALAVAGYWIATH